MLCTTSGATIFLETNCVVGVFRTLLGIYNNHIRRLVDWSNVCGECVNPYVYYSFNYTTS
jgi:hypothetical protein